MVKQLVESGWLKALLPMVVALVGIATAWGALHAKLDYLHRDLSALQPMTTRVTMVERDVINHLEQAGHRRTNDRISELEQRSTRVETNLEEIIRRLDRIIKMKDARRQSE